MHIILGGTGRVGSATARALLKRAEPVAVVTRNGKNAVDLEAAGARIVEVDIHDVAALRKVFRSGRRAFLLNPPAVPATNTDREEHATVTAILDALDGSGLEKVVAASTYGARPGKACGDLTVLYELERRLLAQPIPAAINRGAYYLSNWTEALDTIRDTGSLPSLLPPDLVMPMVAPDDLGEAAARRLTTPITDMDLHYIEGPERYTPHDVATALAAALDRPVVLDVIPPEAWEETYITWGFSAAAAKSYTCMTETVVREMVLPENPTRGTTTLRSFVQHVVTNRG